MKSIRSYGVHGALGLLMGVGAGSIASIFVGFTMSITTGFTSWVAYQVLLVVELIVPFVIYGAYTGYIFAGEKYSSQLSKSGAIAGVICGLVAEGLFSTDLIIRRSVLDPLFITIAIAGFVYGFPKFKSMALLAVSGAIGGTAGYGVHILGYNLAYYLNDVLTQRSPLIILIPVLFDVLAAGLAGASIAIGLYFAEGVDYKAKEIPGFLKKTRNAGIVLTLITLFFYSLAFISIAKNATTEASIQISSGGGVITAYVPVLLDEKGNVLEMYSKPAITGSAISAIIDTEHGKALKITGTGEIELKMKQTDGKLDRDPEANEKFVNEFTLSTSNATRYGELQQAEAWVYSEGEGLFNFFIKRDNGWAREMSIQTSQKPTGGWQVISLSVRNLMYDCETC